MKTTNRNIALYLFIMALSLLLTPSLNAQTKARIQNVDFFAEANKIIINYDLVDCQADESFNIWILVKSASGKILNAKSTSGDIGKGIKGGQGKRIEWDFTLDQLDIAQEISIEVFASAETVVKKTESPAATPPPQPTPTKAQDVRKPGVGTALFLSALLPGLGKTYVKGHGANWLLGVFGYGMVAGSVLMNHSAFDKLEEYRASNDVDERDKLYSGAQLNAGISYICAGGAVIIWVVDFITTGVKAGKARKSALNRVDLNWKVDPYAKVPMIGITYKF